MKFYTKLIIICLFLTSCATRENLHLPNVQPKEKPLTKQPGIALALGGGENRAFIHLGILEVLQENNIPIDLITATGSGSVIAAIYADNNDAYKTTKIFLNSKRSNFFDFNNSIFTGISEGVNLENFLLKNMHAHNFDQLKTKLIVNATDLNTGDNYPIAVGPIRRAVLASSSIPGIIRPVTMYGKVLTDGGISQPVPVNIAQKYNPKIIIAVNIAVDFNNNNIPKSRLKIIKKSLDIAMNNYSQFYAKQADINIDPFIYQINFIDFSKNTKYYFYNLGREAAKHKIGEIKKLMLQKGILNE